MPPLRYDERERAGDPPPLTRRNRVGAPIEHARRRQRSVPVARTLSKEGGKSDLGIGFMANPMLQYTPAMPLTPSMQKIGVYV